MSRLAKLAALILGLLLVIVQQPIELGPSDGDCCSESTCACRSQSECCAPVVVEASCCSSGGARSGPVLRAGCPCGHHDAAVHLRAVTFDLPPLEEIALVRLPSGRRLLPAAQRLAPRRPEPEAPVPRSAPLVHRPT